MKIIISLMLYCSACLFAEEAANGGLPKYSDMTSEDLLYLLDNSDDWHKNIEVIEYIVQAMGVLDGKVGTGLREKEHAASILANALFTKNQYQADASYRKGERHTDLIMLEALIGKLRTFNLPENAAPEIYFPAPPKSGPVLMDLKDDSDAAAEKKMMQTIEGVQQGLADGKLEDLMAKCFIPFDDEELIRRRDQIAENKAAIQLFLSKILKSPDAAEWSKEKFKRSLYRVKLKPADGDTNKEPCVQMTLLEYRDSILLLGINVMPVTK